VGPDGPAGWWGRSAARSLSRRMWLLTSERTRNATVPARLALSWPGTASASGRWVQRIRWMPTAPSQPGDLPSRLSLPFGPRRRLGHLPAHGPSARPARRRPRGSGATESGQSRPKRRCRARRRSAVPEDAGRPRRGSTRAPSTSLLRARSLPRRRSQWSRPIRRHRHKTLGVCRTLMAIR